MKTLLKNKKATLSMELVVKYILGFAAFFILILFISQFLGIIGGQGIEQACRTSVIARDKLVVDTDLGDIDRIVPLNCPPQDLTLPSISTTRLDNEEIRDQFQKEIADLMAQCWWMYGNGQITQIFDGNNDAKGNENTKDKPCGVCYTFYIPTSYGNDEGDSLYMNPILKEDFVQYLATHNYEPGLLQGGGAIQTHTKIFNFEKQKSIPTSFTRILTRERLFASRRTLEANIADLTNIYNQNYDQFLDLKKALSIINENGLQVSFVIVPELEGESFEEYNDLGIELFDEWNLGSLDNFNGIVFLFSLQDGALIYAAQENANAILSQANIEQILFDSKFQDYMKAENGKEANPREAILSFANELANEVELMGKETISSRLSFQQSYLSYVTGGLVEAPKIEGHTDKNINLRGVIRWSEQKIPKLVDTFPHNKQNSVHSFAFGAGYRYAIIFFSNDVKPDAFEIEDDDLPPSIAVVFAQDVDDGYCMVQNY